MFCCVHPLPEEELPIENLTPSTVLVDAERSPSPFQRNSTQANAERAPSPSQRYSFSASLRRQSSSSIATTTATVATVPIALPSQSPRPQIKFLIDKSTAPFRDEILNEEYEVMPLNDLDPTLANFLHHAPDSGMALLTLDREYLRVEAGQTNYAILILPETFLPVDYYREDKSSWLRELLTSYDELQKIKSQPTRVYTARRGGNGWIVDAMGEPLAPV